MIRKAGEFKREVVQGLRGGNGPIEMEHLLEVDKNEFNGKGRLFARMTIKPGSSVGYHKHEGDAEAYYILKGEGLLNDNGTKTVIKAGDLAYTPSGSSHSIENTGDTDLELIALILFS
ncbi:MAG: cupin domain-containing protein [Clostridia bacterium]|nr:cupin domain-containing protein [Clostridia bacterium]